MKKLTCIFLFLTFLFPGLVIAQTGVRFGFKAGYSLATQYGITPADNTYKVDSHGRNGIAGGIFAYFPITESVGIQQELLYAMKGSRQNVTITTPVNVNTVSEYDLNYFEMPIILKYKFVNVKNFGIYGSTGIALSLLMNGENLAKLMEDAQKTPELQDKIIKYFDCLSCSLNFSFASYCNFVASHIP